MPEIGPEHPLTYRQEIAAPIFTLLQSGESCVVVGPASMGKSRLLRFLLRADVQVHYLGDSAVTTWLVLVDYHRLVCFGFMTSSLFRHDRKCVHRYG